MEQLQILHDKTHNDPLEKQNLLVCSSHFQLNYFYDSIIKYYFCKSFVFLAMETDPRFILVV